MKVLPLLYILCRKHSETRKHAVHVTWEDRLESFDAALFLSISAAVPTGGSYPDPVPLGHTVTYPKGSHRAAARYKQPSLYLGHTLHTLALRLGPHGLSLN